MSQTTKVERLDRLSDETGSELWVKRDDLTSSIYGGNKVRKLEFLLGDARRRGCRSIVTTGAYGSHHVLATSLFGARWNFDVHAVLVPQPWTDHARENLRCVLGTGATIHPVRAWPLVAPQTAATLATLSARGAHPYWIPHGGSSPIGALGYVEAGIELATQINAGEMPEPGAIYVALGSGGTAAGLAIGLASAGFTMPIIGVRVTPRLACNKATLRSLVKGTVRELRNVEPSFPAVGRGALKMLQIDGGYYGGGYGVADARTESALRRARRCGLELDPTYTAKAFAAFVRGANMQSHGPCALFWNTLSSVDMTSLIAEAPPLPGGLGA